MMSTYKCDDAPLPPMLANEWADFFRSESSREPGQNLYWDIFNHGVLFPLQRARETQEMMRRARTLQPKVVMEIGADKGGSFYHWVKCHPTVKKAIALEIRGVPYASAFKAAFPDVEFLFLEAASLDGTALRAVRAFLGEDSLDCLFLDGDKGFFDRDFYAYLGFTRPGALVMLHDVNGAAPPVVAFGELQRHFHCELVYDGTEGVEARKRAQRGELIKTGYEGWLRIWQDSGCGVGIVHV